MSHDSHDNCGDTDACYEWGFGVGWKTALEAYMGFRCWCGGEVGPRVPGDGRGVGCMENITHVWNIRPDRETP